MGKVPIGSDPPAATTPTTLVGAGPSINIAAGDITRTAPFISNDFPILSTGEALLGPILYCPVGIETEPTGRFARPWPPPPPLKRETAFVEVLPRLTFAIMPFMRSIRKPVSPPTLGDDISMTGVPLPQILSAKSKLLKLQLSQLLVLMSRKEINGPHRLSVNKFSNVHTAPPLSIGPPVKALASTLMPPPRKVASRMRPIPGQPVGVEIELPISRNAPGKK